MKVVSNLFSSVPPFFAELAKTLAGEIDCSSQTLNTYSTDTGAYHIRPQAVIYPKNVGDIKNIIIFSREYSMPITVCGGQSSGTGGSLGEGIVIDMTRHFNRIRHVNMIEHTVTLDAGVSLHELKNKLHAWNMEIPVLPEGDTQGTIGGLLATKSATASTFHHGTIREWIESVTLVVDTGEEHHIRDGITPSGRLLAIYQKIFPLLTEQGPILRASKPENADDASGYSIWGTSIGPRQLLDQLVGSEGTLGIITSITVRVSPIKKEALTVSLSFPNINALSSALLVAKHHSAENIFMYDETFRTLAYKNNPNLLLGTKELPYHLLVTLRDQHEQKLRTRMHAFIKALSIHEDSWELSDETTLNQSLSPEFLEKFLSSYTNGAHIPIPIASGIIVSPHDYPILLQEIEEYMHAQGRVYTITGYAGSGHISLTVLFDPRSLLYENDVTTYMYDIYSLVKKHKGGISASGGDGYAKTPYLPLFYSEPTMKIFKQIKEIWDPLLVFNPSKKLDISTNTLQKYLRKV